MNNRLGCLTGSGIIAAILTTLIVTGITLVQGGVLFNPGALNAQAGEALGGVHSHAELTNQCKACHVAFWELDKMADRCLACHTAISIELADPHSLHGVVSRNYSNLSCRDCHTDHNGPNGVLTDMDVNTFPHEALGYALSGHQRLGTGVSFQCGDCHSDNHYSPFDQSVCETCHRQLDATFTVAHTLTFGKDCLACHDGVDTYGDDFDHNTFPFPLTGKHVDADCSQCHLSARSIPDMQAAPVDCFSCHAEDDPHQGRFGPDCAACHTSAGWKPAQFDHNLAAFKLEGKHADVACEDCHKDGIYKGTPVDCYACHAEDDAHDGEYGTACNACHTSSGWLPATFDHSLSNFPLDGAHAGLECTQCHVNNIFAGTSTVCVACHQDPPFHIGLFGTECQSCHTTSAWVPARYDRNHPFPVNHGQAATCRDCHATSLSAWTCFTCHAQAEMQNKHSEEGIADFSDCLRCHPTGQEGEGGGGDD